MRDLGKRDAATAMATLLAAAWDAWPSEAAVLNAQGRILAVNRSWRAFADENGLGVHAQAVGADYLAVTEEAAEQNVPGAQEAQRILRTVLEGEATHGSARYPCSTPHERRTYEMRVVGFQHGRAWHVLTVHDDVTEHVVAESKAAARQLEIENFVTILQARNRDLEQFAATAGHDLRGPLRALDVLGERLEEAIEQTDTRTVDRTVGAIRSEVRRLQTLTLGLLTLGRVAQQDMVREDLDLTAMAIGILDRIVAAQPQRDIEVHVQPGLRAAADAAMTRLLLENLLRNAWKYSHDRDIAHIQVGATEGPRGVAAFFVRDNGIGFDPAKSADLFVPFRRLPEAQRYEGAGIGLATASRIVERHGGQIWAEGRPGEGATFWFTLAPSE